MTPLSLSCQVGSRVGVKRCLDDTMHILVDGEDMGPAATGVAKVRSPISSRRKNEKGPQVEGLWLGDQAQAWHAARSLCSVSSISSAR